MQEMISQAGTPPVHQSEDVSLEEAIAEAGSDIATGRANPGAEPPVEPDVPAEDDAAAEPDAAPAQDVTAAEHSPACPGANDDDYMEAATNAVGVMQCHEDSGATVINAIRKLARQRTNGTGDQDDEDHNENASAIPPQPKRTEARAFTMQREHVSSPVLVLFAFARLVFLKLAHTAGKAG